jgi:GNAT superfamily N-acetyltransferase/RimJ/RimL family protein N-acetyltransferase
VQIERFDPRTDEQHVRACYAMVVAGQPEDDPALPAVPFGQFRGGWAFAESPAQGWLAADDSGEPVGCYVLELPEKENRASAFAFTLVTPARRREGFGTGLLAHMAGQAAQAGRSLLTGFTRVGAAGDAFASATGGRPGMRDVRRILAVTPALHARLPELRAAGQAHAVGYLLRSWSGPAPAEVVGGLCAVYNAMSDAPHDASFEPETWDATRLLAGEERAIARDVRWQSVAALAPNGEVAAVTQVNVHPEQPDRGWQEITAVTRPHRGHRLGLLVKVAMLQLLAGREPALRSIVTFNAARNNHMIAVNEQLGYQVSDYFRSQEYDVEAAGKLA